MSPEAQRITIAEICGWKAIPAPQDLGMWPEEAAVYTAKQGWMILPGDGFATPPPDYLNDLNAMHEAEKVLTKDQQKEFVHYLHPIKTHKTHLEDDFVVMHATAAQRAEAFLKTLNLWKD